VLVIDNASTDNTAETARQCWPECASAQLRVIPEPEPGLSHARIRGIREALHEIISFIDDDNWIQADWIARVSAIFLTHPEVGAVGGKIEMMGEVTPPVWLKPIEGFYAVGRPYPQSGDITNRAGTLLYGAGMSLRVKAVQNLLANGFSFIMSGRKGMKLSSGEDSELCFALRASGWRFWYDDDLVLRHFIPKARLQWDYAVRLMQGMGESSNLIELYLMALGQPPFDVYPAWKKTWIFQIAKNIGQLFQISFVHPGAWLKPEEGRLSTLEFTRIKSKVVGLWKIRGSYREMAETIRQAKWAQGTPRRPN
jgi:glycosyltransferase involved in cell wall biosynthesis